MADSDLAARLAAHEHAFEGLLDLIPAKFYNPDDAANQWNKRKQTKEEASQAKRAKLDPDRNSHRSKVSDDGAKKVNGHDSKRPMALKKENAKNKTKTKQNASNRGQQTDAIAAADVNGVGINGVESSDKIIPEHKEAEDDDSTMNKQPERSKNIAELRARLAAKIESMRTKRKAPGSGVDGAPRSRDAILEARRKKEASRSERKKAEKEARKEAQKVDVADDGDVADEPSSLDSVEGSDEEDEEENDANDGLSFGKVSLGDGELLTADGTVRSVRRGKQQDTKSALQAALNKKARLAALPSEKQSKITNSDVWHKALLQADGTKVRDDVTLLKKAVKRKEGIKKKSEKEWKERLSSIAKSKALRQKNREQNLKDRRESKGKAGGHKKGKQIGAFQGKAKNNKQNKKGF